MVDENSKSGHWHDKELNPERVVVVVVRRSELGIHQVYRGVRGHDEEDLHHGVVQRHKRRQQIEITGREDHRKHDLRLAGYS